MFIPTAYASHDGMPSTETPTGLPTPAKPDYPSINPLYAIIVIAVLAASWFLWKKSRRK